MDRERLRHAPREQPPHLRQRPDRDFLPGEDRDTIVIGDVDAGDGVVHVEAVDLGEGAEVEHADGAVVGAGDQQLQPNVRVDSDLLDGVAVLGEGLDLRDGVVAWLAEGVARGRLEVGVDAPDLDGAVVARG